MIQLNWKRSATYWRTTLIFLGFLGSIGLTASAPVKPERSREFTSPNKSLTKRSLEPEIESPSDLAWRTWIESQNITRTLPVRRITAKSVFIAPQLELEPCADGYRADILGRCQKIVDVDQDALLEFLLKKLQNQHSVNTTKPNTGSDKKPATDVTGPLQVNIPLNLGVGNSDSQIEEEETPPGAIPLETNNEEPFIDYNVGNDSNVSSKDDEESLFVDPNLAVHNDNQGTSAPATVVPVVDFSNETNKTFSGIVDYKVPIDRGSIVNHTVDNVRLEDSQEEDTSTKEDSWSQEEYPTKDEFLIREEYLTTTSSEDDHIDDEEFEESTSLALDSKIENVTESPTGKEIISDGVTDIDSEMETWRNESDASPIQGTDKNETIATDVVYEEEVEPDSEDQEYSDTTQISEEDSEDEILKHGETGMMIPIENQALIRSEKKKTQAPKDDSSIETTTFFDIESDPTATTERGEDLESSVSSEVSINKDFIVETTLLDVNSGKVKNSTEPVSANKTASQQNRDDDLKALFEAEKKLITEPEVVFSPQDNHGSSLYGRKRDGQPHKTNFQSIKESHNLTTTEPPVVSKPLPHSPRLRDPVARPLDEQEGNFHSKRILPLSIENKFPFQSFNLDPKPPDFMNYRPIPMRNRESGQNFIKFPNNERDRQSYVRFPSDDVNSIHSPEFKDRFPFPPIPSGNTKINHQFNQRPNWRISQPSKIKNDMFFKFWNTMPLYRDSNSDHHGWSSRSFSSRRGNYMKENSPQEVTRILSQNASLSHGG